MWLLLSFIICIKSPSQKLSKGAVRAIASVLPAQERNLMLITVGDLNILLLL